MEERPEIPAHAQRGRLSGSKDARTVLEIDPPPITADGKHEPQPFGGVVAGVLSSPGVEVGPTEAPNREAVRLASDYRIRPREYLSSRVA